MKKWTFIFCSFFLLFLPFSSLAQDSEKGKVTDIEEGEAAPFAGTLLSPVAYAKIVVKKDYEHSKEVLRLKEEKEKMKVKHELKMEAQKDKTKAVREGYKKLRKRDEEEIKFLRKYAIKNGGGGNFWTGVGAGSAATVFILGGVALYVQSQAPK